MSFLRKLLADSINLFGTDHKQHSAPRLRKPTRKGFETLERRDLLAYAVLETINVPITTANAVTSALTLAADQAYTLRASGTATINNAQSRLADAEYYQQRLSNGTNGSYIDGINNTGLDTGLRVKTASGANVVTKWNTGLSAAPADHTYYQDITGAGQKIKANFIDSPYTDNSGSLKLEILGKITGDLDLIDPFVADEAGDTAEHTNGATVAVGQAAQLKIMSLNKFNATGHFQVNFDPAKVTLYASPEMVMPIANNSVVIQGNTLYALASNPGEAFVTLNYVEAGASSGTLGEEVDRVKIVAEEMTVDIKIKHSLQALYYDYPEAKNFLGDGSGIDEEEYDGQTGGAVTVANLNDTDNDGLLDYYDSDLTPTAGGRTELDMMELLITKPKLSLPGQQNTVTLKRNSESIKLWKKISKGVDQEVSFTNNEYAVDRNDIGDNGLIYFIEIIAPSNSNGDYNIIATYHGKSDRVDITALWAVATEVLHDNNDTIWDDVTETPDLLMHQATVFGLKPQGRIGDIPNAAEVITNGIGIQYTITPVNAYELKTRIGTGASRELVYFDASRQKENRSYYQLSPETNMNLIPGGAADFPLDTELPNDDNLDPVNGDIDESQSVTVLGRYYVYDTPGPLVNYLNSLNPIEGTKFTGDWNFNEWFRIGINIKPDGNFLAGSRASDVLEWHSNITLVYQNNEWRRTAAVIGGVPQEDQYNGIGMQHQYPLRQPGG